MWYEDEEFDDLFILDRGSAYVITPDAEVQGTKHRPIGFIYPTTKLIITDEV